MRAGCDHAKVLLIPPPFFASVSCQEFPVSVYLVSFSLSVYFHVVGVYRGNIFSLYLCIMLFYGQFKRGL